MASDRSTLGRGATGRDRRSTKALILDTAIDLLERRGAERFTVEEVLIESDTSASSLYHHFGSRQGLLVAVEDERYRRGLRAENRENLEGGLAATTTEEFFEYVADQLRRIATDPASVAVRRARLQVAARALDSPDLASRTTSAQAPTDRRGGEDLRRRTGTRPRQRRPRPPGVLGVVPRPDPRPHVHGGRARRCPTGPRC